MRASSAASSSIASHYMQSVLSQRREDIVRLQQMSGQPRISGIAYEIARHLKSDFTNLEVLSA